MIVIEEKIEWLKNQFSSLKTAEEKYQYLILLGSQLPPFPKEEEIEANRVLGCQSLMYLSTTCKDGLIFFNASSDALISRGLAALLISVYSGMPSKVILTHTPSFLHELGIFASLTPSRSNGLMSLHLKMKQLSLKFIQNI
ncbi:MAG: SufE family protein [Simkaniaceae bacterium]|nr:SufE family protein [Simkaniaceae bacterium]